MIEVCSVGAVPENGTPVVHTVGGREVVVVRWNDKFYAVRNSCPHQLASFAAGGVHGLIRAGRTFGEIDVDDTVPVIRCPLHHWEYRMTDGRCLVDRRLRVKGYRLVVEGDTIYADMG